VAVRAVSPSARPGIGVWAGLWVLYLAWGSTYIAMKEMVRTMPPLFAGGARFALAGAVLLAFVALRDGIGALRLERRQLVVLALTGTLMPGLGNALNQLASRHASSVTVALLNASMPLWLVLLRVGVRERVRAGTVLSVPLGFAGVAILLVPGRPAGATTLGLALAFCAPIAWAVGSIGSARLVRDVRPLHAMGTQMVVAAVFQGMLGLALGEQQEFHPSRFSAASLGGFAFLVVIGGFASYGIYARLLQTVPISLIATYSYVNPIVAVGLGWAILGESLTWTALLGALVIVASVAFTVRHEAPPDKI